MKNETEINNALLEIQKQIDYIKSLMGDADRSKPVGKWRLEESAGRKPVGELTFDEAPALPAWAVPRTK